MNIVDRWKIGLLAISLLPWAYIQSQYAIREDLVWWLEGLDRLFSGGNFTNDFFEPNFPLVLLLYLPVYAMDKVAHIPIHIGYFVYTCAFMAVCGIGLSAVLKRYPYLDDGKNFIFICTFFYACTLWASKTYISSVYEFAQREQFIFMAILPMILLSLGRTVWPHIKAGPEFWPVTVAGILVAMIKPHFLIVLVCLVGFRILYQRRLASVFDRDFMAILTIGIVYLVIMLIFFQDFLFTVVPFSTELYAPYRDIKGIFLAMIVFTFVSFFTAVLNAFFIKDEKDKRFIYIMLVCAIVASMPYILQLKGYTYHLFTAKSFLFCSLMIVFCFLIFQFTFFKRPVAVAFSVIVMSGYLLFPMNLKYPTHQDYRSFPLTQLLSCGDRCPVFVHAFAFDAIYASSYYANAHNVSRFINMVFPLIAQNELTKAKETGDLQQQAFMQEKLKILSHMNAEDFVRGKPEIVAICDSCKENSGLDMLEFASIDEAFSAEWKKYRKVESIVAERGKYYGENISPFEFSIYKRISESTE